MKKIFLPSCRPGLLATAEKREISALKEDSSPLPAAGFAGKSGRKRNFKILRRFFSFPPIPPRLSP
ncbi:MAG: hypothetical protein VZQ80_06600 [Lachnospiraceae bacterium]|nr:hypothetical protein [Lachnospiraceae bacterium]